MSIITVLKEADTLIFSTDSRMMKHDYRGVDSDTQQKIFEIAPDTFIATSGRKMASEFQVARARELAVELGTTDIQAIGAALERESLPCLTTLLERLRIEPDETTRQAVSGAIMLHGCTLVGRSGGKLGYVQHTYCVQEDGTIKNTVEAYFEAPRKVAAISGTPARLMAEISLRFVHDMATWTDPLEAVSARFAEAVKRETPTIGGPWQIVRLDATGAHWISQPPLAAVPASETAAGTCNASVSFTAPTIKVTAGSLVIDLAASISAPVGTITGMMISHVSGGSTTDAIVATAYALMACTGSGTSGQNSYISQAGFYTSNGGSTDAFLGPSELMVTGLPSSNPGTGSKKFWYDPSDGNRVKFAA